MQTNNWMFFDGKEAGILSDQERMPTECFFIKRNIQLDIKKHSMSDWMFLDAKEIGIVRFYFPGVPPAPLPASYKCTMTQFRERNSPLNLFVDFNFNNFSSLHEHGWPKKKGAYLFMCPHLLHLLPNLFNTGVFLWLDFYLKWRCCMNCPDSRWTRWILNKPPRYPSHMSQFPCPWPLLFVFVFYLVLIVASWCRQKSHSDLPLFVHIICICMCTCICV